MSNCRTCFQIIPCFRLVLTAIPGSGCTVPPSPAPFTTSTPTGQPFIIPACVTSINIRAQGGGGGGGGGDSFSTGGGGGGGGSGFVEIMNNVQVAEGDTIEIIIGNGGAGGTGGTGVSFPDNGDPGVDTTVNLNGQLISTAAGGEGGRFGFISGGNGGDGFSGGGGGGSSDGGVNIGDGGIGQNDLGGQDGNPGILIAGGDGGNNPASGGSPVGTNGGGGGGGGSGGGVGNGASATGPGGGGAGGAGATSGTGQTGGNGAAGQVMITFNGPAGTPSTMSFIRVPCQPKIIPISIC